jgi:hypothetical protein
MAAKDIEPLIESLKASGTGKAKLIAVAEVAEGCKSFSEFLERVKKQVPPGTFVKIEKWASEQVKKPEAKPDKPAKPAIT